MTALPPPSRHHLVARLAGFARFHWLPTAIFVSGVMFVALDLRHDLRQERADAEQLLARNARDHTRLIEHAIDGHVRELLALKLAHFAADGFNRDSFERALRTFPQREGMPATGRLRWIPRVSEAERPAYEARLSREMHVPVTIREPAGAVPPGPAGPRAEYFPLTYFDIGESAPAILGVDAGALPDRRAAMDRARDSAEPASTGWIRLPGTADGAWGVLTYVPVFHGGPAPRTVDGRRAALAGFVSSTSRIDDLLAVSGNGALEPRMRLTVSEAAGGPAAGQSMTWPAGARDVADALHHRTSVAIGGQTWNLEFAAPPPPPFIPPMPLFGLAITLLACFLTVYYQREQRRHALAMQNTRDRVQALIDGGPDPVWLKDADLRYEFVNAAFARALGRPIHKILGRTDAELLEPDVAARVESRDRAAIMSGKPAVFDEQVDGKGQFAWRQIFKVPIANGDGRLLGVATIAHDVTRLKEDQDRIQEALQVADRRYAMAAAAAGISVWHWDIAADRVEIDGEILRRFGFASTDAPLSSAEWLGRVPEEFRATAKRNLDDAVRGVTTQYADVLPLQTRSGELRRVRVQGQPLRDANGRAERMLGTVQDITEGWAAGQAARRMQLAVDNASEAILRMSPEGKVLEANAAAAQLYGYSRGEMLTLTAPQLDPNATAEIVRQGWRLRQRMPRRRFVTDALTKAGLRFPVEVHLSYHVVEDEEFSLAFVRDISEERRAAEALRERERELRLAQEAGHVGTFSYAHATGLWTASKTSLDILGFADDRPRDLEEFIALLPAQVREREGPLLRERTAAAGSRADEFPIHRANDGTRRWVRLEALTIADAEGKPLRRIGTLQDITERRAADKRLRENEARLRLALEASKTGVWERDLGSQKFKASPECATILGTALDGRDYESFLQRLHPEDAARAAEAAQRALEHREDYRVEYRLTDDSGNERWLASAARPVLNADGVPVRIIGTIRNITARKLDERAMREREADLVRTQKLGRIGSVAVDLDTGRVAVSAGAIDILGVGANPPSTREEYWSLIVPEDRERIQATMDKNQKYGRAGDVEYRIRRPSDGQIRWLHVLAEPELTADGREIRRVAAIQDITESKLAAEKLRESERQLLLAQEAGRIGTLSIDYKTRRWAVSPVCRDILGISDDEERSIDDFWRLVDPADQERFREALKRNMASGNRESIDYRIRRPRDGEVRWIRVVAATDFAADGSPLRRIGTLQDVTEAKLAEMQLVASEARFRSLTELSSDWYWEQDAEFRFRMFSDASPDQVERSRAYARVFGRARWEEPGIEPLTESWEVHRARLERHEEFRNFEYAVTLRDGRKVWRSISGRPLFDAAGQFTGYSGVGQDITERKLAEQRIAEFAASEHAVLDNVLAGIVVIDSDGTIEKFNRRAEEMFGYSEAEALGQNVTLLMGPADAAQHAGYLRRHLETSENRIVGGSREVTARRKDGSTFPIELGITRTDAPDGPRFTGMLLDISARKRAEQAERESELRFVHLFEVSPDALMVHDSGRIEMANEAAVRLYGARSAADLIGRSIEDFIEEDMRGIARSRIDTLATAPGRFEPKEYRERRLDGTPMLVEVASASFAQGGRQHIVSAFRDVTERRRVEQELRRFRTAMEVSGDGVVLVDRETMRYIDVNQTLCDLVGRTREEMLKLGPVDVFSSSAEQLARDYDAIIADPDAPASRTEGYYRRPDGSMVPIETRRRAMQTGSGWIIVGTARDISERKRGERALAESEERFRMLFDSSPAPIAVHRAGQIEMINTAALAIFDATRSGEVVGRNLVDFIEPSMRPRSIERFRAIGQAPHTAPLIEIRAQGLTGRWHNLEVLSTSFNTADGIRMMTAFRDVTEQRQAEARLVESEERFRQLFENSPEPIVVHDRGHIELVNDAAVQMFRAQSKAALLGRNLLDIVAPELRAEGETRLQALVEKPGVARTITSNGRRLDGTRIDAEVTTASFRHGGGMRMVTAYRDITERKVAEDALRSSEQKLKETVALLEATLESTDNGIVVADSAGQVVQWNRKLMELLHIEEAGTFSGNVRGALLAHELTLVSDPAALKAAAASLREDPTRSLLLTTALRDGRHIERHTQPMIIDGRPAGRVWSFRDVTDRVRALADAQERERELEKRVATRTADLALANRELESFSYAVSHDLGAPLRAVIRFAALAVEDHPDQLGPDARRHIDRVVAASRTMRAMIDGLLEFSRQARAPIARHAVDLTALARETFELQAVGLPGRRFAFEVEDGMSASGDPVLLRTLLQNLIGNAIKYSRDRDPAHIRVGRETSGGETVFYVRDDGAGFDARYSAKLFKPFQRLHLPREFEGTGIGLATSRRIVERHGGRIWAESEPGKGATFRFTLGAA